MAKKRLWAAGAVAALFLAAGAGLAAKKGDVITVQVMSAKVMKQPRLIGAVAASVPRGAQLTVKDVKKDWFQVATAKGASGWIHKSNVVEKAVKLNAKPGGGGTGGATEDEVALAGRGFSPEVEAEYKSKHPDMDFSHVDAIEKTEVDPGALEKFAAQGKIGGGK